MGDSRNDDGGAHQKRLGRGYGKLDAAKIRTQNQRLLLNMVWTERSISRAEIARATGLSRSTVSDIVNELVDTGLVSFRGAGDSQGGRRPIMLGFEDDALTSVGVDVGASHVGVAITNLRGKVRRWVKRSHPVRDDPEGTLALIEELVWTTLEQDGTPFSRVLGVGVGVPSPVDPGAPGTLSPIVLPSWHGYDIVGYLEKAFGCPVLVENDANLGALAEHWWGAGRDGRDLAYIKVATGIGSGHIIHGQIYRGARGVAGEIAHIAIDPNGPRCVCGLDGCLGTVVGSEVLITQARHQLAAGRASAMDLDQLSLDVLVTAAVEGDGVAREVIGRAGRNLGIATASLINLMNPATVVFGGDLTRAGDVLLGPLRETLRRRTLWLSLDDARVVTSAFAGREVAIGAATLALHAALDDPSRFPTVPARALANAG